MKKYIWIVIAVVFLVLLSAYWFSMGRDRVVFRDSGSGRGSSQAFSVDSGLSIIRIKHQTGSKNAYLGVNLYKDSNGNGEYDNNDTWYAQLANAAYSDVNIYNASTAITLDAGAYVLSLDADSAWNVEVIKPGAVVSAGSFQGRSKQATQLFKLNEGEYEINMNHANGDSNFQVYLLDSQGNNIASLANEIGEYSGTAPLTLLNTGLYLFQVVADGDWTLTINEK